jgi:hypothetical protein
MNIPTNEIINIINKILNGSNVNEIMKEEILKHHKYYIAAQLHTN